MNQSTIDYYNENASRFTGDTQTLEFTEVQDRFIEQLPDNAIVMDFGCGSGRDSLYFLNRGFRVTAIDGSEEMVRIASELTGLEVKQCFFTELNDINIYDGIWACASLLHCQREELHDVFHRLVRALKQNGVLYCSFKYGTFEGERNGRWFLDMNEDVFSEFIMHFPELELVDEWISSDIRPGRDSEKWLNILLRKI